MSKIIFNTVLIVIVLLAACTGWPYFKKSRINYELKKAASYGTKHSIDDTRESLMEALEEKDVNYDPEDLLVDKNENDTVTISLSYEDSIHFFSIVLKKLEFELEVEQKNIKELF